MTSRRALVVQEAKAAKVALAASKNVAPSRLVTVGTPRRLQQPIDVDLPNDAASRLVTVGIPRRLLQPTDIELSDELWEDVGEAREVVQDSSDESSDEEEPPRPPTPPAPPTKRRCPVKRFSSFATVRNCPVKKFGREDGQQQRFNHLAQPARPAKAFQFPSPLPRLGGFVPFYLLPARYPSYSRPSWFFNYQKQ